MHRKRQRDITLFIVDVFVAITKIKEYIEPFESEDAFRHSSLHWDATIRQLEIIGEALNNLLKDKYFASIAPDYFRKIVNFRNVITHGYFGIDPEEVWDVISNKLVLLDTDLHNVAKSANLDLSYAIQASLDEYILLNDKPIVNFLKNFTNV
jgi:uncharacterized protein with HEPN domain